jgi:hypothetical protein
MTTRILLEQVTQYFDAFSKRFLMDESPEAVDAEVVEPDWGDDHYILHGARLMGITYDRHDDALEIALDSGDHRIYEPREIWTLEEPDGFLSAIQVVASDGSRQVISVKRMGLRRVI